MSLFSGLENICRDHVPLSGLTWYGLGGPARYLLRPTTEDQLTEIVHRCRENGVPMYVLGMGANLLVGEAGVNGAVIKLDGEHFSQIAIDGDRVVVGAAADLRRVIIRTVREGLAGLHCLAGIPGTTGGAIRMNAGGAWGDIGSLVQRVHVMDANGRVFCRERDELVFEYRRTSLADPLILGAEFQLTVSDPKQVLQQVREIWTYKKNTQPLRVRSAGCVFKNPRGLSAGELIEQAGLKGTRIGGAVVSEHHAGFIVAEPKCTSQDVLRLIDLVRAQVHDRMGVELELEIDVW